MTEPFYVALATVVLCGAATMKFQNWAPGSAPEATEAYRRLRNNYVLVYTVVRPRGPPCRHPCESCGGPGRAGRRRPDPPSPPARRR